MTILMWTSFYFSRKWDEKAIVLKGASSISLVEKTIKVCVNKRMREDSIFCLLHKKTSLLWEDVYGYIHSVLCE